MRASSRGCWTGRCWTARPRVWPRCWTARSWTRPDGIRRIRVLSLPAQHRLLGRRVCRVDGCAATVHSGLPGVCYRCFTRLTRLGMNAAEIAAAPELPACPRARISARCRGAGARRRCGRRCCASRMPRSSASGGRRCRWSSSWPTRGCGRCRRCRRARWRRAPGRPTARAATATPTTSAGEQRSRPTPAWITAGGRPGNRVWPSPGR